MQDIEVWDLVELPDHLSQLIVNGCTKPQEILNVKMNDPKQGLY